ncbi:MAG: DoxX family protein [Gammaproteobacteria bacterium]|nr:DoxX family protein [Gammaproteobacteria bacterium]MDH5240154.1 DoxX family protein [Gammaproteobacteria bacterium]MDH5260598.1 DoxX family protein [Gammaproteobacteria bacterium]MDH5583066.1 DoxX family protein [Gammaproteobacteria bacterium]
MHGLITLKNRVTGLLDPAGDWVALLPIRLLMAYEFGNAGMMKFNGKNWFANYQENFLFPFNHVPVEISWFLATWTEILGGLCLFFGLFTRFWAFSLIILSVVAISGVHWPDDWNSLAELWKGYAITNKGFGNYRVPLLFIAMLIPLLFSGAGKMSLDSLLAKRFN